MRILGNNDRLGAKKVNLAGNRHVLPAMEKTARFPQGVLGLLPVVTARRGGGKDVLYAFRDPDDDVALVDAARLVNDVLCEAAGLAGRKLAAVDGIEIAVPPQGWGFSRVEYAPFDRRGNAAEVPVRLHLETCAEPCSAGTVGATVDYDGSGEPVRVGVRVYADHGNYCNIIATIRGGRRAVEKVEDVTASSGNARLVYKRR